MLDITVGCHDSGVTRIQVKFVGYFGQDVYLKCNKGFLRNAGLAHLPRQSHGCQIGTRLSVGVRFMFSGISSRTYSSQIEGRVEIRGEKFTSNLSEVIGNDYN